MAHGLKIWNAAGYVLVDVTDRISRIHGIFGFTLGVGQSGFVSVPGFDQYDGTWFWSCVDVSYYGITITATTDGFNVQHYSNGPSPGGQHDIYVWRG